MTGYDNLLEFIRTEVSDDELRISRERPIRTREPSSVTITVSSLDTVANGAGACPGGLPGGYRTVVR